MTIHPDIARTQPKFRRRRDPVLGPDQMIYQSQTVAAEAFGVGPGAIWYHLDRYGNLDLLGHNGTPVVWRGATYPTISAAAVAAGVAHTSASYHLRRYGNLDRMGSGRRGQVGNPSKSKPVSVAGCSWPSLSAMAADLGVSVGTIRNWLADDASTVMRRKLADAVSVYADNRMAKAMAAQAMTFARVGK